MKRTAALLLQGVTILLALAALAFLLWEPHLEGRNDGATLTRIYFQDPFLAYVYAASVPFFAALYQAFKFLGLVRRDEGSTPQAAKALRTLRYCALVIILFVVGAEAVIIRNANEDRPAGVFMGLLVTLGALAMAATAALTERAVRRRASRPGAVQGA